MQIELTEDNLAAQWLFQKFMKRFWKKVNKDGPAPEQQPHLGRCWIWTAATTFGYGRIGTSGTRTMLAPRASWIIHFGPIAPGMSVLHRCDNPRCIRPEHLFIGTHRDNMKDCASKGRAKGGHARGMRNCNSKFTDEQIREIRQMEGKMSHYAIGRQFGVAHGTIRKIIKRQSWAHID